MSFSATTQQIRQRTKTVTRRLGWADLEAGELFMAIEKGQGLKKGEKVVRLAVLRCLSNRPEPLREITAAECILEGFPAMLPWEFIRHFCAMNHCHPNRIVNRIEFEYVLSRLS